MDNWFRAHLKNQVFLLIFTKNVYLGLPCSSYKLLLIQQDKNEMCQDYLEHSHKKDYLEHSLETRAVLIEIFMLC